MKRWHPARAAARVPGTCRCVGVQMSATPLPSSPDSKLLVVSTFQRSAASRRRSSRSSNTTISPTPRLRRLPTCRLPIEPQPATKTRPKPFGKLTLLRHANRNGLPRHQQRPTPLHEPAVGQPRRISPHMKVRGSGEFDIDFEIFGYHISGAQSQAIVAKAVPGVDVVEHGHPRRTVLFVFGDLDARVHLEIREAPGDESEAAGS